MVGRTSLPASGYGCGVGDPGPRYTDGGAAPAETAPPATPKPVATTLSCPQGSGAEGLAAATQKASRKERAGVEEVGEAAKAQEVAMPEGANPARERTKR
jgi:hypothetical protein